MLAPEQILALLRRSGSADPGDLFKAGDKIIKHYTRRQGVISARRDREDPESDPEHDTTSTTFCNVPGCNGVFDSVSEFESHYNSLHRFNCSLCKKNLPSAHLLDLHLEENHDSYFEVLAAKRPSFRCFFEGCVEKFQSPSQRLDHGIKAHKLPSNFRFATKEKKTSSTVPIERMDDDSGIGENSGVKGKSQGTIRKHISFGHNVPKSFDTSYAKSLAKKEKGKKGGKEEGHSKPLEDNKMVLDLLESLPS